MDFRGLVWKRVWKITFFWSKTGSWFGELGGTPLPRIFRSTPPPPGVPVLERFRLIESQIKGVNKGPFYRGVLKRESIVTVTAFWTAKQQNCVELYKAGERISGVYTIDPDGQGSFDVFCDQTTTRGGWTVFQKRLDGSVDFYRGWADYKRGFGNLNGEFWLELDKIHRLTKSNNRLRVDLEDTTGKTAYAEYDMFAVTSERTKYQLSLGTYSGELMTHRL